MPIVETARRLQERFEKRMQRDKQKSPIKERLKFSEKEKTLFFTLFVIFYGITTIMLFQIELLKLYASDYWILPAGLGSISLIFFLVA